MNNKITTSNISFEVEGQQFHTLNITHYLYNRSYPDHSHGSNNYKIHYIISGYGKLKVNNTYYDLKPNTLYVYGPHVMHALIPMMEDPICEYCINLQLDSPKDTSSNSPIVDMFRQYPFWIANDKQDILSIFQLIFYEMENQFPGYEDNMRALLTLLITTTVRNYQELGKIESPLTKSSNIDTKPVLIDDYFLYEYQSLSLEDLAKRLGLSPRQTERYLKEHYGKTFIQKKMESRMSTAALMLTDSNESISVISEKLGYSSIEHFSTAFKRYYKMSPSEYRKKSF